MIVAGRFMDSVVTGNAVSAAGVFITVGEALDVLASGDLSVAVRVGADSSGGDSAAGAQDHPNNKRTNISDDSRCCCKDIGLILGGFRYKNRKLPHVCLTFRILIPCYICDLE